MLKTAIMTRMIPVTTVLMDSWYASRRLMMVVEDLKKTYYCPVARNRYVTDTLNRWIWTCSPLGVDGTRKHSGQRREIKGIPGKNQTEGVSNSRRERRD